MTIRNDGAKKMAPMKFISTLFFISLIPLLSRAETYSDVIANTPKGSEERSSFFSKNYEGLTTAALRMTNSKKPGTAEAGLRFLSNLVDGFESILEFSYFVRKYEKLIKTLGKVNPKYRKQAINMLNC